MIIYWKGLTTMGLRCFEYLAACTSGFTKLPGKYSFTSALIWALEKLAMSEKSPGGTPSALVMFPTSKLARLIREAPHFPKDQYPSLFAKDPDAYRHIVLAPLSKETGNYADSTAQKGSDYSKVTSYELTASNDYKSEIPSSQHHREDFSNLQQRTIFSTKPQRDPEHIESVMRVDEPDMADQGVSLHSESSNVNSIPSDIFSSTLDTSTSSRSSVGESAQVLYVSMDKHHENQPRTEPDTDIISVTLNTDDIHSVFS
jgi:hypothetical protein